MSLEQTEIKEEKLTLLPDYDTNNPNTHEQIICDFTLTETLGKGTFGVVKLALNTQTGEKVAIKKLNEAKIPKDQKLNYKREIEILKNLKHPNIIRLFSHVNKEKQFYFITEYFKGIQLFQYISLKKKIDETEACLYFQQIINGLEFLHKMGIVHRNIKPENILVDHYLKEIKMIGFKLSNNFNDKSDLLSTLCGSPLYAAPEVLLGRGYNPYPVDIWSIGIVLYLMLSGKLPFDGETDEDLVKKIIEAKIKKIDGVSKEANDLLKRLLNPNPRRRITIPKIKAHPWFNLNNKIFKNVNYYGLLANKYVIPIDEEIVSEIKNKYNISDEEIRTDILANKLNDITTLYYLIVEKRRKEGIESISDFKSEKFKEYIKDENNLLKKYGNDEKRVIKMRKKGMEFEKQLRLERSNTKNIKGLSLEKLNSDEKKEFYRSLSPTMKNSRYELIYNKYNTPKLIKSIEFNEGIGKKIPNVKYVRNDTEIDSIKAKISKKNKNLFIKTYTNKSNISNKKKNMTSSSNPKVKIGKKLSNIKNNRCETEYKVICNNKNEKKSAEKKILNKTEGKIKKIINKKYENEIRNKIKNAANSFAKKDEEIKSARQKQILLLNDNEEKIVNIEKNEQEIQPILPTKEVITTKIETKEDFTDNPKKEIIDKKNLESEIKNNEASKPKNLKEIGKFSPKFKNNIPFKKNDEKNNNSKKQNKGIIYKKKKIMKKSLNLKLNSERKNKTKEIKISNSNNVNTCFFLNSKEKENNKDFYSIRDYLNTEKIIYGETPNKNKINRYFSEELLDIKNNKNENNFKTKKNNNMKISEDVLLTQTNRYLNIENKKIKNNLNTNISIPNDDVLGYNYLNICGFNEPFDLSSIYLNKKGIIKKDLLQKIEKARIKLKKLGNYNFQVDIKNDISFEIDIRENKKITDNVCFIKIKKVKGNNSSIFNCLRKILY